jgi:hypothetical protein
MDCVLEVLFKIDYLGMSQRTTYYSVVAVLSIYVSCDGVFEKPSLKSRDVTYSLTEL